MSLMHHFLTKKGVKQEGNQRIVVCVLVGKSSIRDLMIDDELVSYLALQDISSNSDIVRNYVISS